jgi:hypothetical protein
MLVRADDKPLKKPVEDQEKVWRIVWRIGPCHIPTTPPDRLGGIDWVESTGWNRPDGIDLMGST